MSSTFRERYIKTTTAIVAGGAVLLLMACATTHQVRSIQDPSGFLLDYSNLKEGGSGEAHLVYVDPNADWKTYTKIMIDPVQIWRGDEPDSPLGSLSQEDQQFLVDHLYGALKDSLSEDYQIVTEPGPGVMRLRAAVTEARKTRPVLNLISSVAPMGLGISYTKKIVFGTHTSVGLVQVEAELLDAQTNQRLAAAVDRRAGTKAWQSKFSGRWVDVRDAFDFWARRLQMRLAELRTQTT